MASQSQKEFRTPHGEIERFKGKKTRGEQEICQLLARNTLVFSVESNVFLRVKK